MNHDSKPEDPAATELRAVVADIEASLAALRGEGEGLAAAYMREQEGALLFIAAIVSRAVPVGTAMVLTEADMLLANDLILERGDAPDGGFAVRVYPKDAAPSDEQPSLLAEPAPPVLAKAHRPIILLDTSRPTNE